MRSGVRWASGELLRESPRHHATWQPDAIAKAQSFKELPSMNDRAVRKVDASCVDRSALEVERSDSDGLALPIAAAMLVGVALALAREATYGVAWFGDAIYYVSAARSVLAGEGFFTFDGLPLTTWPPGFPLVLALASGMGIVDPAVVVGPVNVAAHGLTVFVVGNYLRQRLESRPLTAWACLAVALSTPLVDVASRTLVGPLFILSTTLALTQTHRLLTHGDKSALLMAALFSAFAWQLRYLGVALPMVVGLCLLSQRGASWPLRAKRLTIYSAIVALPMGLWALRNYLLAGEPLGPRPWGYEDPWRFLSETTVAVLAWLDFDLPLAPERDSLVFPLHTFVLLSLLASTGGLVAWTRQPGCAPFDWRPCWLFGGFALAYFAALNIASIGAHPDSFQDRYVAPLCVPILMAATFAFDRLLGRVSANKRGPTLGDGRQGSTRWQALPKILVGTLGAILSLWAADQAMQNAREVRRENSFAENTRDLSGPRWLGSETLRHIRNNPLHSPVFSNQHDIVYFNNAGKSEYWGLRSLSHRGDLTFANEKAAIASAPNGAYLVWFRNWDNYPYPFGEAQMRITPDLAQVASLADGAIFKVERGRVPPNPYRQVHRRIVAGLLGKPSAQSAFDIYRVGRTLIYARQPCLLEETRTPFFLHYTVAAPGPGNEDYVVGANFDFWQAGTMLDGDLCVAIVELPPGSRIKHLRTGQAGDRGSWSAEPDVVGLGT